MITVGIICEYNPLHRGHEKQIRYVKDRFGGDCAVVCLMSGNFVQRGAPAILDKSLRARAAILCGADLVLELPVTYALSSAEGFAGGGVGILSHFCDYLCFGSETGDRDKLLDAARALLSGAFPPLLREEMDMGKSFPAARQAALERMGIDGSILANPNDILAVEYCKAILAEDSKMEPLPMVREGSYHAQDADRENPSATAVRKLMLEGRDWRQYVPEAAASVFADAALHTMASGERAVVARLRTMTDSEFEALPYGSEGLWRKFMHACRCQNTLEDILTATKSKRYTRTRLDRMAMCAFLRISAGVLRSPAPYTRVLAFNDTGRAVLRDAKMTGWFVNAGEAVDRPYWVLEKRCGDLYGLFCTGGIQPPGSELRRRVYFQKCGE